MIGLLQRVSRASVEVEGRTVAGIGAGLLVFVAVETGDTEAQARRLMERLLAYRIFEDDRGRINLDVRQAGGSLLLVPQFTLAADTRKGNRPGFSKAAAPQTVRLHGEAGRRRPGARGDRKVRRHDAHRPVQRGPDDRLAEGSARKLIVCRSGSRGRVRMGRGQGTSRRR